MKIKEELNALKEEVETLNMKLVELNEEENAQVSGGTEENKVYMCEYCEKLFYSRIYLEDHIRFIHRIGFPE